MPLETIRWNHQRGWIELIDQTLLPNEFKYIACKSVDEIWEAIKRLQVRGAPAIGIAGALGVVLGIWDSKAESYEELKQQLDSVADYLSTSRPTAVNLFWALDRMKATAERHKNKPVPELKRILLEEAHRIIEEDKQVCRAIGRNGAELLPEECSILTHCNAGALATADYGTALGVIYAAVEMGKRIKVFADETRPLLQGARLTAWELMHNGVDVTLICDDMAATVMRQGMVDCVIVGADRIAANGDTANKIGTYNLAILAREHGLPFYVAAPVSTFDLSLENGDLIPIEQRSSEEITCPFGLKIAPQEVKVYNPAFDVTPARFITAIITEKGVIHQPLEANIRRLLV
jgi:methylthioribose-1-phosphate isomerase